MRIARRSQIIAIASVVVTAAVLMTYMSYRQNGMIRGHLRDTLVSTAATYERMYLDKLAQASQTLEALATGPALREYLAGGSDARLRESFAATVAAMPQVLQLRVIDATGQEQVRVDQGPGSPILIRGSALQDKSGRAYFLRSMALAHGETYLSPLELNRENGIIQRPLMPTLRLARSLRDDAGTPRGILIMNLRGDNLLPDQAEGGVTLRIASSNGEYLVHPDPQSRFGLELGTGFTLHSELEDGSAGPGIPRGQLLSTPRRQGYPHLDYVLADLRMQDFSPTQSWRVIASYPISVRRGLVIANTLQLAAIVSLIALIAGALALVSQRQVSSRLNRITTLADDIASGKRVGPAPEDGRDEVAVLGRAFNRMTADLQAAIDQERETSALLTQSNGQLARANTDLAGFAHAAAHDLKTPLRTLGTLPGFLAEDLGEVDDEVAQQLRMMQDQAERMERLVDGLLDYALVGRDSAVATLFDPGQVLEDLLRESPPPRSFQVSADCAPGEIRFVKVEFEIILRNLLQNAIKHHDRPAGRLAIRLQQTEHRILLEIEDDGPGIPASLRHKALQPLQSVSSRSAASGTGLGLAFVAKIVECRGGMLELADAEPRGLILRMSFPRHPETEADLETGAQTAADPVSFLVEAAPTEGIPLPQVTSGPPLPHLPVP